MPLNYIKLKEFLTPSQKESLLKQAHETTDWIVHKSSKSGLQYNFPFYYKLNPLHFKRIDTHIIGIGSKELLMMMKPNTIQDWHTDIKGRNAVLIYPLTNDYAPCEIGEDLITFPALINTQVEHRVVNNDNVRINFQVPFEESMEEAYELLQSRLRV
tara:strand:- start:1461 stop:1931 length:471 start_codon:yes stop_codon:yes gene_type:complete